jgi:hypothetical protein
VIVCLQFKTAIPANAVGVAYIDLPGESRFALSISTVTSDF